jgi:superfamily II DNA or RNA helicase
MTMSYADFLASKTKRPEALGTSIAADEIHPRLYPFQRDIVQWAVNRGRAALWTTTGTGKTAMQLEWARLSGATSLIVTPLAVAQQTVREAAKLDISARYIRDGAAIDGPGSVDHQLRDD